MGRRGLIYQTQFKMVNFKKVLLGFLVIILLASGGFYVWLSDKYVVPILMYHHIDHVEQAEANTVTPEVFEKQMAYLKRHDYNVISLDALVTATTAGQTLPKKTVVITFDDANEDNYMQAFRVLRKFQFPAIIFVPSGLVNTEGFMSWAQIKHMMVHDVSIGSHTHEHMYLPDKPVALQMEEIFESKRVLERELGTDIDYFAYPIGGFSEEVKGLLKEAGYKGACATNRGYDRFNKDVFELNRVSMRDRDQHPIKLWAKFSGYYNLFRKAKKPY